MKPATIALAAVLAIAGIADAGAVTLGAGAEVIGWKKFKNPTTNFTSSSVTYVPSNMPVNPDFYKQYDDTYLVIDCSVDWTHEVANKSVKIAVFVDGRMDVSIAQSGPANTLLTLNMDDLYGDFGPGVHNTIKLPAGNHKIEVWVQVNPGNRATFRTPVAYLTVMEVALPPMQTD